MLNPQIPRNLSPKLIRL